MKRGSVKKAILASVGLEDSDEEGGVSSSLCGLVYDERMCQHQDPIGPHPERPARITRIYQELKDAGLLPATKRFPARTATREELLTVHTEDWLDECADLHGMSQEDLVLSMRR